MSKTTLDESLERLYRIAADTELKADRSDPYAFDGVVETKQAILRWVADEVIGEDEPQTENGLLPDRVDRRNQIRSEQRKILAKHGYKGGQR